MTTKKKSVPLPDTGIDWSSPVGEFQPTSPAANDAPPAAEQPSSNLRRAADYLPTLVKSAIAVPEFAVGMADLVTGGRAGKFLENEGGAVGFRPKEARAALDEFYSPEQKAAFQEVQNADGFIGTGMAALRNPSVIGQSVVESLGLMGAGGVVARGLGAAAPGVSATMRGAIGEGVVGAGSAAEQIRQQTEDGLLTGKQAALGAASGLADTAFGALGGKIAQRLGIADVDTMLAGKGNPAATKGFVRSLLEGAASEGLLEELPQSISEQVLQNVALGKPVSEGVDQAAVLGLLSGGLMGGGANAVNSMFPAAHPADEIRATKMPTTGPLTKGLNAAIETHAETVESTVADAVTQTRRQETAPIVEQLRSLPPEQQDEALQMMAIADNMQAPGPVRRRAQNRLDFLFASVAPPVDAAVDPTTGEIAPATGQPPDDMNPPRDNLAAAAGSEQQPVSEADSAASRAAAVAQREADRPESAITPRQDGDILTGSGNPFKDMTAAMRALSRAGDGFELARVDGGLVVRKTAAPSEPVERETPTVAADLAGDPIDKEWTAFTPESGTKGIPRAEMPQIQAAHRGPMVNFLNARGITHETVEIPAGELKPTQAEFSPAKVQKAKDFTDTDRSILVSSDGHVLDGHHQWLARLESNEPVKAIRLNAPIADLITTVREFPSAGQADGATTAQPAGTLQEQWQDAVKRGDAEAAAKINDLIVAEKKARKAAAPADDTNPTSGTRAEAQAAADQAPAPARSDAATPASVPAAGGAATAETGGVTLSGEEVAPRDVSGKPLRAKIIAWARTALGGKSFRNQASGSDISVTWQGIKHATSKANDPELRLVAGLPELLQRASYSGSEPDSQKRPDIKAIHRYAAVADLGGERLQVGIVVREMQDGHRFYDHFILPNENPAGIPGAAPRKEVLGVQPTAGNLTVPKTDSGGVPGDRAAPAAKPKPSANTIITDDAAEKARAILRAKLGQVSSGIDPEIMSAGITLALYHVEKGARTFAAYTKAMVGDLGDTVRPYLKSWYAAVLFDPRAGAFTAEMTPLDKLDAAPADEPKAPDSGPDAPVDSQPAAQDTAAKDKTDGSVPTPPRDAARELDQPGQGTLEGAPSTDVRAPGKDRQTRAGADGRGRRDGSGAAGVDRAGDPVAGRLGADPGDVPVPARRTRQRTKDSPQQGLFGASGSDAGTERLRPEQGGLIPGGGVNEAPNGPGIAAPQFKAEDFTIDSDLALGEGGQKTKFKNNVAAIRLLRDLEATGRLATPDEQRTLAQYVGWGGLPQAFDPDNADWSREHKELSELLTPEEFAEARKSTRYAHYTSREIVVDGVYAALRRFGFTGGKTLEAGAGVGNFIGMMPADMRSAGRFTAIEREPFSGAIARQLYPKQNVQQADFTEFKGSDGYFDAAVGNPPFASDPQVDRSGRKHLSGLTLHNYFFAKAIDMLREGGVMGQVITNSFMDAKTDAARRYIGERTRFLGAIRLPNNAFSKNANTEVTTDIVFLQKLPDAEIGSKAARADAKRWIDTVAYTDKNGAQVALNRYFADNPHMMLGDYGAFGTMYGPNQPALVAKPGQDTLAMLKAAVEKLPEGVFKSLADAVATSQVRAAVIALKNPPVREGGYFLEGDKLIQRVTDIAGEPRGTEITPDTAWTEKTKLGESGFARIKALSELRSTVRALIAAEMADDDKNMGQLRAKLNEQYDSYRDTHGLLNDPSTLRVFDDDPDYPLLASLETDYKAGIGPAAAKRQGIKVTKSSAKKSAIFTRRVVAARTAVRKVDTAVDALAVSMAERGKLDAAYIGDLLGKDPEAVLKELSSGDKPALFLDPATSEYVLRDAYLSGNVRAKLAQAREAGMVGNARELEAVQPEDVGAHEISARVGSPWVPESVYEDFARELFGEGAKARVRYLKLNSSYQFDVAGASEVALNNTWGTPRVSGDAILSALLNNKPVKVVDYDSEGKPHTNVEATEAANVKAQDIRDRFGDWLFKDPDRAEMLVRAYNDTNNNYVTRVYDGSMMTFPGKVPDEIIKFRRHQRNAIARTVQDRTALYDHVVGAGKTFTVIASAMELKRTGLAKKPMIAVPNHLVKQWAADFYRLYPGANILTATKKDFLRENRRKFLAKIATGDWDAVVIAHSSFGFIKPAPEFEADFNGKQIADIVATIKAVDDGDGEKQQKKRTIKQLEGLKERLENRVKALRDKPMDDLLDFQQIGVDQLFVDEFHMFKNLMFSTKMQNVQGLGDSTGSQRAYDMYVKIAQIFQQNGRGQGVVAATGTPVSNSLAEMYHMMRYLMPTQMEELGFGSFDAWANTFASVEQVWMQKPSGDGFKASNRMSNFVNTTELLKMFDQVCDTVTMDDIKAAYREENEGAEFPLPQIKTGRRQPVSLEKSPAQDAYMEDIAKRAKALERRRGPPQKGEDNTLVIMGDARKAAMDIRLVDPNITEREPGGRIDRAAQEIDQRYRQYQAVRGTQLVFSDLGTPIKHAKAEMKEFEALRERIDAATDDVQADAALGDEVAKAKVEDAEDAQAELDAKGTDWLTAVKAALRGFSVYDDLKAALIERGIPENEIAFIHDYNTDDQKAGLFKQVNAGQIRVLIGSTAKMGAGTNVQERLVALHHLDVPWRPSDVEQREGRIIRQGNALMKELKDFEAEILAYVTRDTLDMRMWQVQETKLKMINQLRTRKVAREVDNAFEDMEMSAGEMQAAATGNMDLLKEIQLRTDVKKLEQRQRSFDAQAADLQSRRKRAERLAEVAPQEVKKWTPWAEAFRAWSEQQAEDRKISVTVNGKEYTTDSEAGQAIRALLDAHQEKLDARKAGYDAAKEAAKAEFPGDDGESAAHRLNATEAYSKAHPLPKLSIEFNNSEYTSKTAVAEAFIEAVGDSRRFDWSFDGKPFIHRQKLASAIADRVMDAGENEAEQEVGSFGPFEVSVEGLTSRIGTKRLDVIVRHDGKTISDDIGFKSISEIPNAGEANARAVIDKAQSLVAGAQSKLYFAQEDVRRAEKALKELSAVADAGEWPDKHKLDAARQAHKEVLKRLSTAAPADAASDGDPAALFSRVDPFGFRNSANRVEDIVHLVDQITSRWANAPEVVVAESRDDPLVPPDAFDAGSASKSIGNSEIGSDIGGMYYKKTGVVYLFADKLPGDVQVINVLFHEALGHAGLRGTFGKELGTLLDRLAVLNQGKVRIKARQYDLDYEKPSDRRIAAEELLAEMAQRTPDIGWVKRAIAAIKSWLRDHIPGFSRMKYSDSELIRNFILPSRRFVMQGRPVASVEPTQEGEPPAMFSRSPSEVLRSINQESIRNAFLDATTGHDNVSLWAKTVGTQYDKAQRHPQTFGRVFNAVQDYIKDISSFANAAADQAPHILPKLDKLSDLKPERLKASGDRNATKADLNAVGAVIFQGTLDKQLLDRPALLAKGLTEKQADLYDEFRAAVNQSLDDVAKTEIVRLAGIAGEPMAGRALAAPTAREAADIMADYLRQQGLPEDADGLYGKVETVEKLQSEGYAPLMRFGKHTVHIQQDGETLFFGMYESRTEANAMARQLRGDPEFSGIPVEQGVMSQESYKLFNGLSIDSLELFANEVGGQDNPVYQDFLKLTKNNRSALKRLIHRNGTAGFSTNTERVLASFVTSNARLASGNLHLGRAKQAANDIPRELGDLKDEAVRLVEYVQNPQEEAQAVRGLLFTTFIGGSVASAVVNMTQPLTMTLPYLSQFGGLTKAGARMVAALKIVAGGKASGEIGQALKRAEADGIVSPQEIHHLQAATTDSLSNNPYLKKAAFIWGSMFSLAEQFNRRLSFVAAYQTALDTGVANPFAFAEKAVIETQGLYNKGNKANWARGAIGSTAMTFKQFSTHYIEWITRMHQSGPEGKRAAITALAILMLAGGAGGLPFADDLDDLIDTLAQALGYDFSAKQAKRKFIAETLGLGDTAADVATRGVTALPGFPMDLSLRMGMGNLLPATGMFLRSNTDRSRDLLEVAGAAGGLAKMALDGGEKLLGGDPLGAAKAVVPLAIQNVAKSAQMWTTGEYRNQKGAKVTDVDGLDAAMKFIGFQPAEVARESAKVNSIQRTIQLAKNVEADLAGRMAQARVDGDIEAEQEARQELIDWNRKNPQSPIRIRPADIARRAREMRASRVDRLVKSAPKELRPAVQDALN